VGDLSVPPVGLEKGKSGQDSLDETKWCREAVKRAAVDSSVACRVSVHVRVSDTVSFDWETILIERRLFVEVPKYILPDGSKERYELCLEELSLLIKGMSSVYLWGCNLIFVSPSY
jgi:hypothetical protein